MHDKIYQVKTKIIGSTPPFVVTLIPTRGLVFTQTINSVLRELGLNVQPSIILTTDDLPLPASRNALVEEGLKIKQATHLLLVDDDVVLPIGALKAMLDLNTDIAIIDYPMHYDVGRWKNMGTMCPDNWTMGEEWKDKTIKWAGLGCALIRRKVFEQLGNPWFVSMHKSFKRDKKTGKIFFVGELDTGEKGGEDCFFYGNALKKGFNLNMVKNLTCGHARVEKFVMHLQGGKYETQHKIKVNDKIDQPFSTGGVM